MRFGDYEVLIVQRPLVAPYRIFMYRKISDTEVEYVTKNGIEICKDEYKYFDEEKFMFGQMYDGQLRNFADAITKMGIQPKDVSVAEGKLQATEKHLEDMRTLVFNKKKETK